MALPAGGLPLRVGAYRIDVEAAGFSCSIGLRVRAARPREVYGLAAMDPAIRLETAGNGAPKAVAIAAGTPLEIAMPYALPDGLDRPQFGIGVIAADGHVVYGPGTALLCFETGGCPRRGTVVFTAARTALLPGTYRVMGGVFDYTGKRCFSFDDAVCVLTVAGPAAASGLIDLRATLSPLP